MVHIADGSSFSIVSDGIDHATFLLTLKNIFYCPKFLVSFLTINQLMKNSKYSIIFLLSYCIFEELHTKKRISMGCTWSTFPFVFVRYYLLYPLSPS